MPVAGISSRTKISFARCRKAEVHSAQSTVHRIQPEFRKQKGERARLGRCFPRPRGKPGRTRTIQVFVSLSRATTAVCWTRLRVWRPAFRSATLQSRSDGDKLMARRLNPNSEKSCAQDAGREAGVLPNFEFPVKLGKNRLEQQRESKDRRGCGRIRAKPCGGSADFSPQRRCSAEIFRVPVTIVAGGRCCGVNAALRE